MPKKEKKEFDGRIWPTILEFNVNIDKELTSKANFLFGASTLIMFFVANKILTAEFMRLDVLAKTSWLILLLGSFLSFLVSMMIVLPRLRMFSNKERIKEDVFYYKNILNFYSRREYVNYLKDLPLDSKRISLAYANQIYSLATYVLPFKFRLLKISGWILILTILFSITLFIASLFS